MARDRFSKGQWIVFYQRDSDHPSVYSALDGKSVLSSGHARHRSLHERIANCAMAAAAPEMLELLRALREVGIAGYMDEIDRIIAKATDVESSKRPHGSA